MTGAEILIDALKREEVDIMFGYPGGSVIPIFDVLNNTKEINFILTRHEQGATHAADGYARSTGKVGVCLVTSGPGATNTITGIATAKLDSIPIVVISGQVPTKVIGTDAFQEADVVGITRSICKHNFLVNKIEELPYIIKEAFHIARSGRPGPVAIDLPKDVTNGVLENYSYPKTISLPGYKPTIKGNMRQIKKLANALEKAEKPLFYTGGGVVISGASNEFVELAEKTNIPVVSTLLGLGSIPYNHELFLGMPGMHGRVAANYALQECDLLISIGARFDDRVTGKLDEFAPKAKIAHIDVDPAEIGKNVKTEIPVVGDAKSILQDLLPIVKKRDKTRWNEIVKGWSDKYVLKYRKTDKEDHIAPQYVVERINEFTTDDTILVTDVGQHQMWAALYYNHRKPRNFLSSGGLGTMGYGLPAAMGAAAAYPNRQIVLIAGDGSIQMNIQEFATCAINNLNVKVVILNNAYLGMVRQWQEFFWDSNYSKTCLKQGPNCPPDCKGPKENCPYVYLPNFVKIADANGLLGFRAQKMQDVDETLRKGFETDGTSIMEFMVNRVENVYPMVPAGKPINEILMGEE